MTDREMTDEELDKEFARGVSAARHAPKLSDEPRAMDLREVREQRLARSVDSVSPLAVKAPAPKPAQAVKPSPSQPSGEAEAWDRYASAALALFVGSSEPEADAAIVADRLLVERRDRFG